MVFAKNIIVMKPEKTLDPCWQNLFNNDLGYFLSFENIYVKATYSKVRSLLEDSRAIFISFKIVVIFNITSADFVLMSFDVVLKMATILKEMMIM